MVYCCAANACMLKNQVQFAFWMEADENLSRMVSRHWFGKELVRVITDRIERSTQFYCCNYFNEVF